MDISNFVTTNVSELNKYQAKQGVKSLNVFKKA